MPLHLESLLALVDVHWKPDISTLPERVRVPLVSDIQVRSLLRALDADRESRLRVESARVERRYNKRLRPRTTQLVRAEGDHIYSCQYFPWV